ncbi:MAG: 1,4-alpha-glucan branching protein domain-containing protein [Candidatus Omnitrophota bacterium]
MAKGYLSFVLHTHLPFVRHPEEEYFLEENWFFEAVTETYIPLVNIFDRLISEGIHFRLTMSLTPPLVSMMQDELLQHRYIRHINKLIELSEKELERTAFEPHYHGLALMYNRRFIEAKETFLGKYNGDLALAFKKFQDMGCVEIIASCATHGFLPILGVNPSCARAQILAGVDHYQKTFDCAPKGFWLPECGYYPGVDALLREAGIKYFFVDSHGIVNADPAPRYSVYAPVYCPSGVAAFARDWESSKQVWSSKEGYPGDVDYREYYRDIGYELDYEYIKPYIHPEGFRINTGLKYWRITGDTEYKEAYNPDWAREKAAQHAGNFMFNREKQVEFLGGRMDRKPIIISPYDAELFGHWWFEGPMWLDFLIRKITYDQDTIKLITPSDYLREYPVNQMAYPSASSWGWKGYSEVCLEGSNDWIYRHLHAAGERMSEMAGKFAHFLDNNNNSHLMRRALNQAARELFLAESSDWPFIMKTGTMVAYANKRVRQHLCRFNRLYNGIMENKVDAQWLKEIESKDNIFFNVDCLKYYLPAGMDAGVSRSLLSSVKKVPRVKKKTTLIKQKDEVVYAA